VRHAAMGGSWSWAGGSRGLRHLLMTAAVAAALGIGLGAGAVLAATGGPAGPPGTRTTDALLTPTGVSGGLAGVQAPRRAVARHIAVVHTGTRFAVSPHSSHAKAEVVTTPAPAAPPVRPAPVARTPAPAAAVASAVTSQPAPVLPLRGRATAFGCPAALAYLEAYAAPDFILACPGNAQGHDATTECINGTVLCSLGRFIAIAVPCPAAYMNEASNSWVLMGLSFAPIDPYGSCR
jgi:hypothetical protein